MAAVASGMVRTMDEYRITDVIVKKMMGAKASSDQLAAVASAMLRKMPKACITDVVVAMVIEDADYQELYEVTWAMMQTKQQEVHPPTIAPPPPPSVPLMTPQPQQHNQS